MTTNAALQTLIDGRFVRFLAAGGVAALVNVVSRYILSFYFSYSVAIVISFCFGVITAFVLSRRFVFSRSNRSLKGQAGWFLVINLLALVQVWGVSMVLAEWLFPLLQMEWRRYDVAHVIGVLTPVATSYFAHKHVTFRAAPEMDNQP